MRKIIVFNMVTVDGLFAGPNGELDWVILDPEFHTFSEEQTRTFGTLVFGETTYKLMESVWPTAEGDKSNPGVAELMRNTPEIVFSKTIGSVADKPNWKNVTVLRDIQPEEVAKWKKEGNGDIGILGSGTIVQQFGALGLVDEYRLLVMPIILGKGKSLFRDAKKTDLKLIGTKIFKNGSVLLRYETAKK